MPPPAQSCQSDPSRWILRFAGLVPAGATVLDVACGGGRHARLFLDRGARVTCVDRDLSLVGDLAGRATVLAADLEDGSPWPLAGQSFAAVVVVNYLHRPLLPALVEAVAPGGVLLYETFAAGNERYSRPRNPDHLLRPGELLAAVAGRLQVVAYEAGLEPRGACPRVIERICAARTDQPVALVPPSR